VRLTVKAAERGDFAWLVERTHCAVTESFRAIKAVDAIGRILGMVGYDLWTLNSVQAHMAVDSPIAWRAMLRPAFAYPFLEAGMGVILAVIPAGNARSVHLATRFGFRPVHRVRDGWAPGEDLIMLEMRREECRWLEPQRKVA
jgi:hypothetical protein